MTILFKTSATLLRNLFPSDRYYFEKKDTVATASFCVDSLQNLAWLGGRGYDLLGLYIHGVCYKRSDGSISKETYCPIMLENLADPILTGREELGIPKMFSDIDISRDATSYRARISWRGAQWATLEMTGLQALEDDPTAIDGVEGLLVHKYIPSGTNKPDADYDILHPNDPKPQLLSVHGANPSNARLEICDMGKQSLPTLHPIVSRLAELPIMKIVGASVKEFQGVPSFANMQRLS